MDIIKPDYKWAHALTKRTQTTLLILHHSASTSATAEGIHAYHISLGWAGIAYHFLVRKDGSVYEGRPIDMIGGHTKDYNYCSIGICFEGNFEVEYMGDTQLKAGQELIASIIKKYPNIHVGQHKDYNPTECAGAHLPFNYLVSPSDEGNAEKDDTDPSDWAKEACDWAVSKGLFLGYGSGNFNWHDRVTREELAVVLKRFAEMK